MMTSFESGSREHEVNVPLEIVCGHPGGGGAGGVDGSSFDAGWLAMDAML